METKPETIIVEEEALIQAIIEVEHQDDIRTTLRMDCIDRLKALAQQMALFYWTAGRLGPAMCCRRFACRRLRGAIFFQMSGWPNGKPKQKPLSRNVKRMLFS